MKILVDARPLVTVGNGNARYLSGMLEAATAQRRRWHWHLISHRPLHSDYAELFSRSNVEVTVDRSPAAKAGPVWLHLRVPALVRRIRPDLFWSTLGLMPFQYRLRCPVPSILNIHDMNPFVASETMRGWVRIYMRQFMKRSILEADRVLCLSDTTRQDIIKCVPTVEQRRLVVQYPGMIPPIDAKLRHRPDALPGDVKDFFLAVGTLEPRKNFDLLIQAYQKARIANPHLKPLVFAGHRGWNMSQVLNDLASGRFAAGGIHYAGTPSDGQLLWLYENASALFFPSLHEGFGLPALEAAWFNKPVYLSDIRIFREILPAAVFTDTRDVDGWAERFLSLHKRRGKAVKLNRKEWTYESRSVQLCAELEEAARRKH